MPGRKIKFENDKYYHVFNRGVDKRRVFLDKKDFVRFLESMWYFNTPEQVGSLQALRLLYSSLSAPSAPLVDIIAYCLLPNHYHFLLKQVAENGISKYMQKVGQGCTNYFNSKYGRTGSLFGGAFKSVPVTSDYQLWQASCYINGNAEIHGVSKAEKWPWSSCLDYLGIRNGKLCNKNLVLKDFEDLEEYKELLKEVIKNSKEIKEELKEIALD